MCPDEKKPMALALISGLDSLLAAKIVRDQNVDVTGIHFYARFDNRDDTASESLLTSWGIPLLIVDFSEDLFRLILHPAHGHGSGVNPCIDCRLLCLKLAHQKMREIEADFLVTGEVVGQRPMTQNKPTLYHIDKVSGLRGLIVRPLTAKCLPPTLPEEKGWVDRDRFFDFAGRTRTPQIALARTLGFGMIPQPAGGCILTDLQFARRFRRLLQGRGASAVTVDTLILLRLGRHIWPSLSLHVIVGRNESENLRLESLSAGWWRFFPENLKGPLALAWGISTLEDQALVAGIVSRYSKGEELIPVCSVSPEGHSGLHRVAAASEEQLNAWRLS